MTLALPLSLLVLGMHVLTVRSDCAVGYDCTPGSPYTCAAGYTDQTVYAGVISNLVEITLTSQLGSLQGSLSSSAIANIIFFPGGSSGNPLTTATFTTISGILGVQYSPCTGPSLESCDFVSPAYTFSVWPGDTISHPMVSGYGFITVYGNMNSVQFTCSFTTTLTLPCPACAIALKTGASRNRDSPGRCQQTCPSGAYLGATACDPCSTCASGKLVTSTCSNGLNAVCSDCPAGNYCPTNATQVVCPSGFYCPAGVSAGIRCEAGKISVAGISSSAACTCLIGTVPASSGSGCVGCSPGTYWDNSVSPFRCVGCPFSMFSIANTTSCYPAYFRFDTRSGDFQFGPDGSVQYTASSIPKGMGSVTVSTGSTTVNGQIIPRGMQIWTVENSGLYDIVAVGAAGAGYPDRGNVGGRGVTVKTRTYMTAGMKVIILVGQKPPGCRNWGITGGGGGSFITVYSGTSYFYVPSQHTPVLIAGGGGGSGLFQGIDAVISTSGVLTRGYVGSQSMNGGGGGSSRKNGGNAAKGISNCNVNGFGGSGGAGFIGDGGDECTNRSPYSQSVFGGTSFLSGGMGGFMGNTRSAGTCGDSGQPITVNLPPGGFGGGGTGFNYGAGGGGYNGGQGCDGYGDVSSFGGAGGSSYDISGVTNTAQLYTSWDTSVFGASPSGYSNGYSSGDGAVAISLYTISVCSRGKYTSGNACQDCPAGTFSTGVSMESSQTCTSCGLGTYSSKEGAAAVDTCISCPAGALSFETGATSITQCVLCTVGNYLSIAISGCAKCPVGKFNTGIGLSSSNQCLSCMAGTYSSAQGAVNSSVCTLGPAGMYNPLSGQTSTETFAFCMVGTYSPIQGSSNVSNCVNCSMGTYSLTSGASASSVCMFCSIGTYSKTPGSSSVFACQKCTTGTYSSGVGATACTACPQNSNSSSGDSRCTAKVGYFLDYRQLESYTGNGTIGAVPDGSLVVFNRDFESSVLAGVRNRSITILNSYGRTTLVQDGQVIATDNGYPRLVSATTGAYLRPFVWYKFDGLNCSWDSSGNQNHFSPSAVTACLTEYYNGLLYPTTVNSIKGDMSAMFRAFGGNQVTRVRIPSFNWESMQKTFGFSIAFWMNRPYGYESMQAEMILSLSEFLTDPCTLFNNFRLFRSGSARSTTFLLYGNVILTNYMPSQIQPGVYEVDGYWHHHVISVTKQGVWTTWIDGIDMNTSFIGNFTDVYPGNQRLMTIGGEVCQDRQNLYAGMDDFRIYPAPLTSTQVRELYLGTVGVYTVQYSPCNSTACSQDTHLHCTTYGAPVCCGYGTYFLEGTSDECVPCPAGTNSDGSGSTCTTCPAGQYLQGETCRDCVAGAYSSTVSQSACTACPAGSYSALARASSSSVCTNCSAGTYQPTPGAISVSNCTACPSGTYLVDQGAASPLQCVRCDAGKYSRTVAASSSSTCQICVAGTFSTGQGSTDISNCTNCTAGTYSSTPGATTASTCTSCDAGKYSRTVAASSSSTCQICVAGTFSTGQGSTDISNCTNCTAGTYSSTPGATAVSACIQCAAGLYASALGSTACTACPSQSNTSSTGSAQRAACVCYPGTFGLPAAFQACGLCPANYYCNSTTQLPCPYGTLSFPGSITVSKCGCPLNASAPLTGQGCACDPGFRQATNGLSLGGWDCRACEANTYCLAGGQLLCPDFSASTVLSGSILDCKCNRGYYWNGTLLQCVTCPVDSYCNGGLVYRCPASTFSPMRSSSQAECRCSAGYACSRTRQTRLTITFRLDAAQFQAQQAIVRQKLAILAGVPESSVVLNSTNGVGRRLLESQYVEISAHVPVENLPGDVMILH